MTRLFVAIELPASARTSLAAICRGIHGAKWANPNQLHLTLSFIGEFNDTELLEGALKGVQTKPFELTVRGTGIFPRSEKRARVLWAGLAEQPALFTLQQQIEQAVQQYGVPTEDRPWSPHITLSRFKVPPAQDLKKWLAAHADLALPPIFVDRFHLFESMRERSGAVHTIRRTFRLEP